MIASRRPDLARALAFLPAEVATAVREASAAFTKAGVKHALCGRAALASYGISEANDYYLGGEGIDVAFVVGDEIIERRGDVLLTRAAFPIQVGGVAIRPVLASELPRSLRGVAIEGEWDAGVPIVSAEVLIALALLRGQGEDEAATCWLIERLELPVAALRDWLVYRDTNVECFDAWCLARGGL